MKQIRARVTQRPSQENRFDTAYIAPDGRVLKTKNDVARYIGLTDDGSIKHKPVENSTKTQQRIKSGKQALVKVGQGRPRIQ